MSIQLNVKRDINPSCGKIIVARNYNSNDNLYIGEMVVDDSMQLGTWNGDYCYEHDKYGEVVYKKVPDTPFIVK